MNLRFEPLHPLPPLTLQSVILCARGTLRSSEQSTITRTCSENVTRKRFIYSSQNNKIVYMWICRHIFGEIHEVRKGLWTFSFTWFCFSDADWQANSHHDHVVWVVEHIATTQIHDHFELHFWSKSAFVWTCSGIPEQLFVPQD